MRSRLVLGERNSFVKLCSRKSCGWCARCMQSRLVIGERMSSENKNGGKTVGDHKYNTCETQVLIGAVQMPQYLGKVHGGSTSPRNSQPRILIKQFVIKKLN